jgi:hypothetical protein
MYRNFIAMRRGSVLRVEEGRDMVITVWQGELWLTQEGDRRDRYLAAGQSFRLDRPGTAIASAMSRSLVSLSERSRKPRVSLAERLRRLWAGLFSPHARPTTAAL